MTKAGNMQSKVELMYRTVRVLVSIPHLLRELSNSPVTRVILLMTAQAKAVQCLGYGLQSL